MKFHHLIAEIWDDDLHLKKILPSFVHGRLLTRDLKWIGEIKIPGWIVMVPTAPNHLWHLYRVTARGTKDGVLPALFMEFEEFQDSGITDPSSGWDTFRSFALNPDYPWKLYYHPTDPRKKIAFRPQLESKYLPGFTRGKTIRSSNLLFILDPLSQDPEVIAWKESAREAFDDLSIGQALLMDSHVGVTSYDSVPWSLSIIKNKGKGAVYVKVIDCDGSKDKVGDGFWVSHYSFPAWRIKVFDHDPRQKQRFVPDLR